MRNIREISAGNVVNVCFNRELVYAIAVVEPRIFVLNLELYGSRMEDPYTGSRPIC